jgi:CheY-like chemotaxis protein
MKERQLVLVVEDTEEDFELLKIAIRRAKVTTRVELVRDGQEAIDYLCGAGKYADRGAYPFPGVLFLDLKLPRVNGFEVLKWLKEHEQCKVVPVMVLTSSELDQDVDYAYRLGANCYMVKPNTLDKLVAMVDQAFNFWWMCALPPLPVKC